MIQSAESYQLKTRRTKWQRCLWLAVADDTSPINWCFCRVLWQILLCTHVDNFVMIGLLLVGIRWIISDVPCLSWNHTIWCANPYKISYRLCSVSGRRLTPHSVLILGLPSKSSFQRYLELYNKNGLCIFDRLMCYIETYSRLFTDIWPIANFTLWTVSIRKKKFFDEINYLCIRNFTAKLFLKICYILWKITK